MVETQTPDSPLPATIASRLASVRDKISGACNRYGRDPSDIRLIAVSKTWPVDVVRAAVDAGQMDFAENRIQDALIKIPAFVNQGLNWHFIGPMQSNKTRHLPGNFAWWHTLDRLDIARRVSDRAMEMGVSLDALVQVNVINDPAKSGVPPDELPRLLEQLTTADLPGITVRGLMTIGPQGGNEVELRDCFARLRNLLEVCRDQFGLMRFDQLSMGMTDDMAEAIAEGATMLRIGSAIFGPR